MDWDPFSTPGHLISRTARAFARVGEARLKPLGFGMSCLPVLVALKDGASCSQKDLARLAKVEQPSMAQMLARMERDSLVRRVPDPADGRSSMISLTAAARARLPEAREALLQGSREALAGFTEAEVAILASLLGRLIRNLDQVEAAQAASGP